MKRKPSLPIEVNVEFGVKEIPGRVFKERESKYAPVLVQLSKRPGKIAQLGAFASNTAISLVTSLKNAAKKTDQPDHYHFSIRRNQMNMDEYLVFGQFDGEAPPKPERKPRAPRVSKLDEKFPDEDAPQDPLNLD